MGFTVSWDVLINGASMTTAMRPYLISISATDKEGSESDTCSLTLDDTNGQLKLPQRGEQITVRLEGVTVFEGYVSGVMSNGSRSAGRKLTVNAKGFDDRGKIKEPQQFHLDDATLEDFLTKAAQNAGLSSVTISPALASIERPYWAADAESFLHLGQRLARELHATFKIRLDKAVFVSRAEDAGLTSVLANADGGNVISWSINPISGRNDFTEVEVRYFDRETAAYKTVNVSVESGRDLPDSINRIRTPAGDKDQAENIAEARKSEADNEAGGGSVVLDITPAAQAEATLILTGARPGVDGVYRITSRTHSAGRSSGAKTSLQIKKPQEGAGSDTR